MNTIKLPGFTAEMSLRKTHKQYRLAANDAEADTGAVIPQYRHCFAMCTFYDDPIAGVQCGPPYHYYCYGDDFHRHLTSITVFGQ